MWTSAAFLAEGSLTFGMRALAVARSDDRRGLFGEKASDWPDLLFGKYPTGLLNTRSEWIHLKEFQNEFI